MRAPYLDDGDVRLYLGDCIEVLAEMEPESVDAVVCDPPYGLEFMGKDWDSFRVDDPGTNRNRGEHAGSHGEIASTYEGGAKSRVAYGGGKRATTSRCTGCGKRDQFRNEHECAPNARWAEEIIDPYAAPPTMLAFEEWVRVWSIAALRVLKPGGHLLAFGGTRTFHRLTCGIEDAGFEIRDCLSWLYGSGFPKSLDVSKAIDKAAGAERQVSGPDPHAHLRNKNSASLFGGGSASGAILPTAPATDAAREWQGWGTALKPGHEPAVVARKPHTPQTELAAEAARAEEELCAVVSYAATVTSWSELLRTSGLSSIASSLRDCLVDLSTRASTFTTETASSLTTDLAIWRSSLSPITLACITRAPTPEPGMSSAANAAAVLSRSVLLKCERLTATTAGETAIARPAVPGLTPASGLDNPVPAWEPCVVARKPLSGTVAENVQQHGTGALNIDGCRIGLTPGVDDSQLRTMQRSKRAVDDGWGMSSVSGDEAQVVKQDGRWPANVALDEQAAAMLDAQSGERPSGSRAAGEYGGIGSGPLYGDGGSTALGAIDANTGGASRFFYTSKASRADRNTSGATNTHPTVKPTDLMRWLVRLVTPPGGVVLDPFAGSGSTLVAARAEGFRAIGIEREEEYAAIIADRLSQLSLFSEAI